MGKKEFIMNGAKPSGIIEPDNSLVFDEIFSLLTEAKTEEAQKLIDGLDLSEDDPDYYFMECMQGFVHLESCVSCDDENKARTYAEKASRCLHAAQDHGVDLPGMEKAVEFADLFRAGDFDTLDEIYARDYGNESETALFMRNMGSFIPLMYKRISDGDDFVATIRIVDDLDLTLDDFREYLSDVHHMKSRKKKEAGSGLLFTVEGAECSLERLSAETDADADKVNEFIRNNYYKTDFEKDFRTEPCNTVLRLTVSGGKCKSCTRRGMIFFSVLDAILASCISETVSVFGYLYDGEALSDSFDEYMTATIIMNVLPVPELRKADKGYAFTTCGFSSYGFPELTGTTKSVDEETAYGEVTILITEVLKYEALLGYGDVPEGVFDHVSGLKFLFAGMMGECREVHIL